MTANFSYSSKVFLHRFRLSLSCVLGRQLKAHLIRLFHLRILDGFSVISFCVFGLVFLLVDLELELSLCRSCRSARRFSDVDRFANGVLLWALPFIVSSHLQLLHST